MKYAVISDIHSNHIAFEKALNYIDDIHPDCIIFLGDYVTDCPYPQKTMKLLYECISRFECRLIRGNREDYLIDHRNNPNDGWCYGSSKGTLLYTYENLTNADINFFASLPVSDEITVKGYPSLHICHGSPENTREWIKDDDELINKYTRSIRADYLLCGHIHRSAAAYANGKKVIFCPSLGLSSDKTGSSFIMLEYKSGLSNTEIFPIEYDRKELIAEFYESGLLEKSKIWGKSIIKLIEEKTDYPMQCVRLAWQKSEGDTSIKNGILPEIYWEQAARELGII